MTLQMNLFDDAAEKLVLFQTIDKIKNQFGSNVITKAINLKNDNNK